MDSGKIQPAIDVLGFVFSVLTRREEVANATLDEQDCFPTTGPLAYRPLFLGRPPADEGIEVFWAGKRKPCPGSGRERNCSRRKPCRGTILTCRTGAALEMLWVTCQSESGQLKDIFVA